MSIQYVQVKVDTTGLFQPASMAQGVVGIAGEATAATGPGVDTRNPQLFTRPLTGAPGEPYATEDDGELSQLAKSINLALTNGALKVWAYRLDAGEDVNNAFNDFINRQINIVCLANKPAVKADDAKNDVTKMKEHVENASPNDAGGGGTRPRIGVAMLPKGDVVSDSTTSTKLADFGIDWTSSRMVLVAHNSDDDVAAAVAGTTARYDPWISLVLKEVTGITQAEGLPDSVIEAWLDPEGIQGVPQARVNPIVDPEFLAGAGLVMGEGYTADGTGQRLYIDIVRTIDDLAFQLKANLTNPNVIGTMRINRPGLTGLRTLISALLDSRVAVGEIDGYTIDIPLLGILQKDPAQRTPEETQQINTVQNSRRLEFSISVDYSGAIHYLIGTLKLV